MEKLLHVILLFLGLSILASAGTVIYKSLSADGKVTYCYVESTRYEGVLVYHLYGFRPWRPDRSIGTYSSLNDVNSAVQLVQCEGVGLR